MNQPSRTLRARRLLAGACIVLLLSACATSPRPQLYTLMPGISAADPPAPAPAGSDPLYLRFANVSVPEPMSRTAILARRGDPASEGQVVQFPRDRWLSSYAVEVRESLRYQVTRQLGAQDAARLRVPLGEQVVRVGVRVDQLDRVLGQAVTGEFSWTVSGPAKAFACQARLDQPMQGDSAGALVRAERGVMAKLAAAVAGSIDWQSDKAPPGCTAQRSGRSSPARPRTGENRA